MDWVLTLLESTDVYLTAGDVFICFSYQFDRAVGTHQPSYFSLKVHERGDSIVILYFKWPHYIWNIGVSTMLPRAVHRRRRLLPPRCPLCIISAAKDSAQSRTIGYYWIKELYLILHNPHLCGRPICTWINSLLKQFYKVIH